MINDESSLAAVFTGPGQPLELKRMALPVLRDGELLVRVTCCTLCGSDIHSYQGHRNTAVPTILGHEILGRVAALGPGQPPRALDGHGLNIGDRVTWSVAASCGACFFCADDVPQKCERLFKYGHERVTTEHPLSGGLAEYCHIAPGTGIVKIPDELSDNVATPANCATATVCGAFRCAGPCAGQTVLIQGAGMLGLTAAAFARDSGAKNVIVSDMDEGRLELSRQFGATHTLNVKDESQSLAGLVKVLTDSRGLDLALELTGASSAIESALPLLRVAGRYMLLGAVFPVREVAFAPEMLIRRMLRIQGVHNYAPKDLAAAVSFLARNYARYPFESLVAAEFDLSRATDAFNHAIEKRPLRVAVKPGL